MASEPLTAPCQLASHVALSLFCCVVLACSGSDRASGSNTLASAGTGTAGRTGGAGTANLSGDNPSNVSPFDASTRIAPSMDAGTATARAGSSADATAGSTAAAPAAGAAGDASAPVMDVGSPDAAISPPMTSAAGSGGMGITGGSAAPSDEDEDGGTACMPLDKPLDVSSFPRCSAQLCAVQDSVCVQNTLLKTLQIPQASIDLLANCDSESKCVPTALASQAGKAILPSCTSTNGAEGRCLSPCIPRVGSQASLLPKDSCRGTDLCAPCFDPRTGENTGACNQGCDPGPTQAPKVFAHCCSDRGRCVPPDLAGSNAANLRKDTCSDDDVCAPIALIDPLFRPKACSSIDNAEGRCLSTCLGGAVAQQLERLPTQGCGSDEVCAPCFDPITGEDTGACTINGDRPLQAAYMFARCCDNGEGKAVGVCVTAQIAGDQASMLRADTCTGGRLCAPIARAKDPNAKFARCLGLGTGACVPSCILDPVQAGILSRTVFCETGELCAPCDLLGVSTGACD